jgi:hypothetical protein
MNCEEMESRLPDYWSGRLDGRARVAVELHLGECEACRREAEVLERLWSGLGLIGHPEPSRELRSRFYDTLEAYQQGLSETRAKKRRDWFAWWPQQPAWQLGAAAAMLVLGVVAGYGLRPAAALAPADVAQLQSEVRQMRQLVALSLLQQQSASERLRGVNYAYQADPGDAEVLGALLDRLREDANVNVRLAAVDAVRRFGNVQQARSGLVAALADHSSPLVQVAIIDALTDLKVRQAAPAIRALETESDVAPAVRERAKLAVSKLE